MAQIRISELPPAPNGTGSGSPKGTDLVPATDTTDTSSAASGTTKKYTQSAILNFYLQAQGLTTYTAVRVATTLALTVLYANGTLGVGATLTNAGAQAALSIDGVALAIGDRVLVKNQASDFQNGIYTVTSIGSIATNWVMTRATDYDQAAEVIQYAVVLSDQGTVNAGKLWQETGPGPFTIGTTSIIFSAYSTQSFTFPLSPSLGGTGSSVVPANGEVPIGNGSVYVPATITQGSGITITNGPGSITISSVGGGGLAWSGIVGTSQAASVNTGYIIQNASLTTVTLPASCALGDTISIRGLGAAGWVLTANAGQTIILNSASSSVAGSVASVVQYDTVDVQCIVADTVWTVNGSVSSGLTIS